MSNFPNNPIENLAQHIAELQKKYKELEARLETTNDKLLELAKANRDRIDRIQRAFSNFEVVVKNHQNDFQNELNLISGQMLQNRMVDNKVSALIQKHNEQVLNFERSVTELKKQMKGQDMKLLDVFSRLNSCGLS